MYAVGKYIPIQNIYLFSFCGLILFVIIAFVVVAVVFIGK